jgi:hypothetical protein
MSEKLDPKEIVTFKELLMSEVVQSEALTNLLDRKGIISKEELLEEIKKVKAALPEGESGKKRAHSVTKEEALEIAAPHVGMSTISRITDDWNEVKDVYNASNLPDCWYVFYGDRGRIGSLEIIAISKKDGRILDRGRVGQ